MNSEILIYTDDNGEVDLTVSLKKKLEKLTK